MEKRIKGGKKLGNGKNNEGDEYGRREDGVVKNSRKNTKKSDKRANTDGTDGTDSFNVTQIPQISQIKWVNKMAHRKHRYTQIIYKNKENTHASMKCLKHLSDARHRFFLISKLIDKNLYLSS